MRFVLFLAAFVLIVACSGGVGVAIYEANQPKVVDAPAQQKNGFSDTVPDVHRLLVFGGPWCSPCVHMQPIVDRERLRVQIVEYDPNKDAENRAKSDEENVTGCPTFISKVHDRSGYHEIGRFEGVMTQDELDRLVDTGEVPHREPTQVLDSPNRDEPQPERPHPIRSLVTGNATASDGSPAEGADGWRLRLFYPRGDAKGEALKASLGRMTNVANKYGFEADTTDDARFARYWRPFGYPRDKITIVLVRANNEVAYYQHKFPADAKELRDDIRSAAAGKPNLAVEFEAEIGGHPRIKER